MFTSLVNGTLPFIHALVKAFADPNHPVGEFLHGLIDKGIGHVVVMGVGHRASDGGEGVSIPTKGDGQLDAIHIVARLQETDDGGAYGAGTGGIEGIVIVEISIALIGPVGIIRIQDVFSDEFLVLSTFQMEDGEGCGHRAFDAFGVVMRRGCRFGRHTDALLFRLCQPSGRGTAHSRAVAETAIRLGIMAGHPEFELTAKACVALLVGTLPEVHRHVEMVYECLCAGKGEYGVVSEACPRAEHLHLVIVLDAVCLALVDAACYVSDSLANQVIPHMLCFV